MNLIQKTFQKIDEYKNANALAEQAKIKLAGILSQIETIEKQQVDRIKEAYLRIKKAEEMEKIASASINRTEFKLERSIEDLNKEILDKKKAITDLIIEETEHNKITEESKKNKEKSENDAKKSLAIYQEITAHIEEMKKEDQRLMDRNKNLESVYAEELIKLENARKENAEMSKRKQDLDLYARRIQRYYDEAKINIKI